MQTCYCSISNGQILHWWFCVLAGVHYRIWFVFGGGCTSPGSNERWFEEIGCTPLLIYIMQRFQWLVCLRDFEIFLYSISLLKFASQIFWGYQWENSSCPLAYCLDRCSLRCLFFRALSQTCVDRFPVFLILFAYFSIMSMIVCSAILYYIYLHSTKIKGKIVRNVLFYIILNSYYFITEITVRWLFKVFIDVSNVSSDERYSNGLSRHQNFGMNFVLKIYLILNLI